MSYVMLTTRCNMKCRHCGFACTEKGEDMSWPVFKKALKIIRATGEPIVTLGGGEPTLHRRFWDFVISVISIPDASLWLATNGTQTETAIKLAGMARNGILGCALSQDRWHDNSMVDAAVIAAFTRHKRQHSPVYDLNYHSGPTAAELRDRREIRDVGGREIASGRMRPADAEGEGCICPDLFFLPDGHIKWCGCADAPIIGTVWSDIRDERWQEYGGECYKFAIEQEEKDNVRRRSEE